MDLSEAVEDDQKFIIYKQEDLFGESFPVFKEIRYYEENNLFLNIISSS